ncbi:bacterial flagellin [Methylobacterium sp. GXF4]|jgi:flagellin|uniref:flagellin N-terminal helical domain-containing protein n=1 Tax=Methylobacterium sp. GXF4 TaxID=1096546 RepID=UPI00026993B6|nr:flagellin [Methylobacterium sp. GXF4]EIZ82149.1 bacterial flagellin [Methylobacterium sp. GXF4]
MSSPITLTSATRSSLLSLQNTQSLQDTISERLSTGKKVNSALDNPVNFFTASGLNSRSSQLTDLLDGMSNGIQTIQAASKGIDGMKNLVQQMQSTVKQARQDTTYDATDATTSKVRDNLKTQYLDLAKQINTLAKDSGYNGVNLLNGEELNVTFNEKTGTNKSDITVSLKNAAGDAAEAVTAGSLGITTAGAAGAADTLPADAATFTSNEDLDKLSDLLTTALTSLSTKASSLGSSLSVVQTRQDFTKQIVNVLKTGSDNLVNADMNEEAANFTALQTRQSIAQQTLSLANQQQQGILQLLR